MSGVLVSKTEGNLSESEIEELWKSIFMPPTPYYHEECERQERGTKLLNEVSDEKEDK